MRIIKEIALLDIQEGDSYSDFCLIILILDMLNDTIKTPDEVVERLGLSTLGSIPYDPDIKKQLSQEGEKK